MLLVLVFFFTFDFLYHAIDLVGCSKYTSVQLCFPSSTITGNLKSSLDFDSTLQKHVKKLRKVQPFEFAEEEKKGQRLTQAR